MITGLKEYVHQIMKSVLEQSTDGKLRANFRLFENFEKLVLGLEQQYRTIHSAKVLAYKLLLKETSHFDDHFIYTA